MAFPVAQNLAFPNSGNGSFPKVESLLMVSKFSAHLHMWSLDCLHLICGWGGMGKHQILFSMAHEVALVWAHWAVGGHGGAGADQGGRGDGGSLVES